MQSRARLLLALAIVLALLTPAASTAGSPGVRPLDRPQAQYVLLPGAADAAAIALVDAVTPAPPSRRIYTVGGGDTLGAIAQRFEVTASAIIEANGLANPDSLSIGQRLLIPSANATAEATTSRTGERGSVVERLPDRARNAPADSPFYRTTWVTYYGRPEVPILGILGEYSLDDLVPVLRRQAHAYDEANGADLGVRPALHLIYGMATARSGEDDSHLTYLEDDAVQQYIDRAAWEGMGVILDVQIGNVTPLQSIEPAFPYLKYKNVQLALDPEFAMVTPGQEIPGQPPGAITAEQINEVQAAMVAYMEQNGFAGHKALIVHQFLPYMIHDKATIDELPGIDLVICADGFGAPSPKISKYNAFMDGNVQFGGFKLFYRWDEPIMNERQALGVEPFAGIGYMEKTPSLIVYQ